MILYLSLSAFLLVSCSTTIKHCDPPPEWLVEMPEPPKSEFASGITNYQFVLWLAELHKYVTTLEGKLRGVYVYTAPCR